MARPADWWVLDLDRDPVPGEPYSVRSLARSWARLADDAEWAETRVRQLLGDGAVGAWIGEAGDAFRSRTGDLPEQLGQCKDSYRLASEALDWWADRLDVHQDDADAALVKGRMARADLEAAQARADAAAAAVRSADFDPALLPSPEQVRDARARLSSAQTASSSADAAVASAQARLDAARQLALDAASLRDGDAHRAAARIHEASDAGIPERSRWEKLKDWAGEAWDVVVTIAKVVVAVLGIVALIIGGPLAWVVFAAALLVLADTIMKYMQDRASLWEVAFSALACIPGTKGLTTLAALQGAFRSGGALGAGAHIASSARLAVTEMAAAVRAMGGGMRTTVGRILDDGLFRLDARFLSGGGSAAERWMSVRVAVHHLRGGTFTDTGNLVIRRWTPVGEPGPLTTGFPANTFRSASYDEVLLVRETTLSRAITETGNPRGLFWTSDAPVGPLETQLSVALKPEWNVSTVDGVSTTLPQATHYVQADFPTGTTVFQGPAEVQTSSGISDGWGVSIPGTMLGGGEQIVPHPYFMRMWDNAAQADGADPAAADVLMNLRGPFEVGR
jgi:hypothetical protein